MGLSLTYQLKVLAFSWPKLTCMAQGSKPQTKTSNQLVWHCMAAALLPLAAWLSHLLAQVSLGHIEAMLFHMQC